MSLTALYDLPAPAKLNLFLHVTGRRADGYHLLQSLFVLIDWADTLHLERRHDGRLLRHDLGPALPADDLCLKAARALQQASGCPLGADISIDKQLPWGAGMGGGSSDAATVLMGLNRLWGLHWTRQQLLDLGARLGADVPFFIGGHNAIVQGIGEQLTPAPFAPLWLAVLKPPQAVETAKIFSHALVTRDTKPAIVAGLLAVMHDAADTAGLEPTLFNHRNASTHTQPAPWFIDWGRNDLQAAAQALCPDVAHAGQWLEQRFGNSRMTGSGSAVFASAGAGDQPVATWSEGEIPEGWVGRMCRSLVYNPISGWLD